MVSFSKSVFDATPNNGSWDEYKFSPKQRTVYGKEIYNHEGTIHDVEKLLSDDTKESTILYQNSLVTIDFGLNTCGLVSIEFGDSTNDQELNLSYSESRLFIDKYTSDRSMDFFIEDGVHCILVKKGVFKTPWVKQRGAFRYLTLWTDKAGSIEIKNVNTHMTCMPSLKKDLSNYSGYFYSNDDFVNTIWYAGAYTIQLSTMPSNSGRRHDIVMDNKSWFNDAVASFGEEFLADGARRDRSIWSGDRSISVLTEFISFNSNSTINGSEWMLNEQLDNGQYPYACSPISTYGSDLYHLWTLVSLYQNYKLSGCSLEWVKNYWPAWKKAINFSWEKVDETGTLCVSEPLDWGRNPLKGHVLSVNCILYHVLMKGSELALSLNDNEIQVQYLYRAKSLKNSINEYLWNENEGLFRDYEGSEIHSQDGNTIAIWFDVASNDKKELISDNLTKRWTKFGAVAPESPGMISPFISSIELFAHTLAGHPERSFELFKNMWGYIWNSPYSVQSSLIEGYYHDGSCKYPFTLYDPSYISHCHPWATGPTVFYSFYHVGLQFISPDHSQWNFIPKGVFSEGSLEFAQTGYTSKSVGFISAGWKKLTSNILELAIKAPKTSTGTIGVPNDKKLLKLELNGTEIDIYKYDKNEEHVLVPNIHEGNNTLIATYKD